ncbi:uncharacterized protein LOC117401730 [Acipenser ruthenus]|uniref:uncharacterized protein LOC117401730 n=1 Tax=Acipenser ruthenus TaxID=7906 RepID=UPI002740518E|nr:uncharacterized protein LOC117401730 [Acipenser ruthenus]
MSNSKALSFLTLPGQAALTAGAAAAAAEGDNSSAFEEEDDEEEALRSRLLPKSSPIPRRRGLSLVTDAAEYLLTQVPSLNRKVSFADAEGLDLVEVKFFHKFDEPECSSESDEDADLSNFGVRPTETSARVTSPIYQLSPAFVLPTESRFLETLRAQKVAVEGVSSTDDPLSALVLIRVLNVSYQKSVYVRSTMDNWSSYFDHFADYVPGSFDGETDQFTFKLMFSPPFLTDGARIEFVVRYETPEGVYWANNGGQNYAVILKVSPNEALQSGDDSAGGDRQGEDKEKRPKGILKPAVQNRFEAVDQEMEDMDNGINRRYNGVEAGKPPPEIQIEDVFVSSPSSKTKDINTDPHSILTEATPLPVPSNEPPTCPGYSLETTPKTTTEVLTVIPQTKSSEDTTKLQNLTFKPSHTSTFAEVSKHANPGSDWNLEHLSAGIASILGTPNLSVAPIVQEREESQPDRQTKAFVPDPEVSKRAVPATFPEQNPEDQGRSEPCAEILGTGTIENTEQEVNEEDGGTFLDSHTGSEEILEEETEKSSIRAGEDVSEGGMGNRDTFTKATEDILLQPSREESGTLLDDGIGKMLDLIEAGLELSLEDVLSSSTEKKQKPRESFGQRAFEAGKPKIEEDPFQACGEDLFGMMVCSWPHPGATRAGPMGEDASLASLLEPENLVPPTVPETGTGQESDDVEDLSDVECMKDNQLDLAKDVQEMTTARRPVLFKGLDLPAVPETRGSPEGALSDLETQRDSQTLPAQPQSENGNLESPGCRVDTQEFLLARNRGSGDRGVGPKLETSPPAAPFREVDHRLNQALSFFFACWSLVIIMAAGFYHPTVFLVVGLYLLSLCF